MPLVVDNKYRINIFLDTNILVDIIDKTFPNLNFSINYLTSSSFVTLKSSHYSIFEFVEVRKREHFLRDVVRLRLQDNISISKLVGKKGIWKFDNVKYEDHKNEVKRLVSIDKEKLSNDFVIEWENNTIHNGLLAPTLDLCLDSTISREDSLLLMSCAFPNTDEKEDQVILLSRDKDFNDSYNEADIESILSRHDLRMPEMLKSSCLYCDNNRRQLNLNSENQLSKVEVEQFWTQKIKETIIKKNINSFLGHTYSFILPTGNKFLFFSLQKGTILNENIALTIIGKDLDFIYSTRIVLEFWNNSKIESYPFVNNEENVNISFRPYYKDDVGNIIDYIDEEILAIIKEEGNLVFLNTDS